MSDATVDAIERVVVSGAEPDDVLRAVLAELVRRPEIDWAGILFLERGDLVLGPEAGDAQPTERTRVRISYQGAVVGELAVDGVADVVSLERVAELISTHVLLGWDTGGEPWEP
jgi:putative methionine-R-sulfoxide reductase with GAF domain